MHKTALVGGDLWEHRPVTLLGLARWGGRLGLARWGGRLELYTSTTVPCKGGSTLIVVPQKYFCRLFHETPSRSEWHLPSKY